MAIVPRPTLPALANAPTWRVAVEAMVVGPE